VLGTRACSQAGRQPLLDRVVAFLGMAAAAVLPHQRNPHLVEFELGAKLLDGLMIRIVACHGSIAGVCHQATPTPTACWRVGTTRPQRGASLTRRPSNAMNSGGRWPCVKTWF